MCMQVSLEEHFCYRLPFNSFWTRELQGRQWCSGNTRRPLLRSAFQTPDPMWGNWLLLTTGQQLMVQNLDQLYVLVSFDHKITCHDITYTVLKAMFNKNQISNMELQNCFDIGPSTSTMLLGFTAGLYGAAPCRGEKSFL